MKEEDNKKQLQLLYELLRHGLAHGNNPAGVGKQALELILHTHSILRGEIFLLDEQNVLRLLALCGYAETNLSEYEMKVEQRLQQKLIQKVVENGTGLTIPDVGCQDYWDAIPGLDDDICSVAVLPLVAEDKVIGVMSLLSEETGYFTEERQPLLMAISATVALVIKNANLIRQVRAGQEQLRQLADQLIYAQETERKRVASTLHDDTGQTLTALQLRLIAIENELPPDSPIRKAIQEADSLLIETVARIRRLAYTLRPPELDTLGLNAALERLCQDFGRHYTNIAITYEGDEVPKALPESVATSFYRCLQEALTNVAKHAQASKVQAKFHQSEKNLRLEVKDNGCGISVSSTNKPGGLGLLGMKERFERIDGKLILESNPDSGTTLVAVVPWQG